MDEQVRKSQEVGIGVFLGQITAHCPTLLWNTNYPRGVVSLIVFLCFAVFGTGCGGQRRLAGTASVQQRLFEAADSLLVKPVEGSGGTVGISIRTIGGENLYDYHSRRLMEPSSVQKLAVAADAMLSLPDGFRMETRIWTTGRIDGNGILYGDLVIEGGWDPGISGSRPYSDWPWTNLRTWAAELHNRGLRRIDGDLVAVGDIRLPGGWEVGDLGYRYAPVISQLCWNDGLVTEFEGWVGAILWSHRWPDTLYWSTNHTGDRIVAVEPGDPESNIAAGRLTAGADTTSVSTEAEAGEDRWMPVADPRILAADALRQALQSAGIEGGDNTRVAADMGSLQAKADLILTHRSELIDSLLRPMLVASSNSWAEQISAAVEYYRGSSEGYHPGWLEALNSLGVDTARVRMVDACGMSRKNNMSAGTVVDLLIVAYERWGPRWFALLPRPGERFSTLLDRLDGQEDRVIAKTGGLSRAWSLAGYVHNSGRPLVAFCIMINNCPLGRRETHQAMDRFVAMMADVVEP